MLCEREKEQLLKDLKVSRTKSANLLQIHLITK